jgi:hypothetical protein
VLDGVSVKALRMSGEIIDARLGSIWYITFDYMDHLAFRKWAEDQGVRYRFTDETNRVRIFTEMDAMLCYLSFV